MDRDKLLTELYNSNMTRKEREHYSKTKPLAVMGITNNCGLAILEMQHGIDDYVVVKGIYW